METEKPFRAFPVAGQDGTCAYGYETSPYTSEANTASLRHGDHLTSREVMSGGQKSAKVPPSVETLEREVFVWSSRYWGSHVIAGELEPCFETRRSKTAVDVVRSVLSLPSGLGSRFGISIARPRGERRARCYAARLTEVRVAAAECQASGSARGFAVEGGELPGAGRRQATHALLARHESQDALADSSLRA